MIDCIYKPKGSRIWRWKFRLQSNDGKIQDVSLGTSDKQVAEKRQTEWLREKQHERDGLILPKPLRDAAQRKLTEHLEDFLGDMRRRGKSEKYLANLQFRVGALIPGCGWNTVKDVTADSFQTWRRGQAQLSAKTVNDYLEAVRCFFNWLIRNGRAQFNPLVTVEKVKVFKDKRRQRRAYTDDEMRRLLTVVPADRRAIYLMAALTGLRRSELAALKWGDFYLDGKPPVVKVRASTTKNGTEAGIRLRPELVEALKSLRVTNGPDEIVFEHFPRIERLRRDLKLAGIASVDAMGRHADFHSLRKTVGTNLAKAGEPRRAVMDFMRLSDGKLADDIYTDVNQLDTGAVVDVLPDYTISPSQGASQELVAASQNGSSGGTVGDGTKADKIPANIGESHIVALHVTSGHNMENGGSGGARTRNLCRDRAAL